MTRAEQGETRHLDRSAVTEGLAFLALSDVGCLESDSRQIDE